MQRFGRHILEALLFLRERGIPSHGHLHSGNVILQNGVARYAFDFWIYSFTPTVLTIFNANGKIKFQVDRIGK